MDTFPQLLDVAVDKKIRVYNSQAQNTNENIRQSEVIPTHADQYFLYFHKQ